MQKSAFIAEISTEEQNINRTETSTELFNVHSVYVHQ